MEYKELMEEWKKRRETIRAQYATKKYSIRSLAKVHNITDARIWAILHEKTSTTSTS